MGQLSCARRRPVVRENATMKKALQWTAIILGGLIGLVVVAAAVLLGLGRARFYETFEVEAPALAIPTDTAALARGEHLVTAVAHCGYCHGDDLAGDIVVDRPNAVGVIVAPNLTAGAGGIGASYTIEDWVRALRHGVLPEGRSVFIMPSLLFAHLGEDDLAAIIAYLQSVPPVDNALPETQPGLLAYALLGAGPLQAAQSARHIDHDAPLAAAPLEAASAAYGEYLAYPAQCAACHGLELAGGQACSDCPIGPNLTPGGELQGWTEDDFVSALRTGIHPSGRQLDEVMPSRYFRHMTDTEVAALWAFLQAQPPRETAMP